MSNVLKYKGYRTQVNYSCEDGVLFGKIEGINALVTFEAETANEIKNAFIEAVDNYLSFCEENDIEPEKEYKGCFNVRITPELHRNIVVKANSEGITLNKYVENALTYYLNESDNQKVVIYYANIEENALRSYNFANRGVSGNNSYLIGGYKQ